jgi:hypothetical protein
MDIQLLAQEIYDMLCDKGVLFAFSLEEAEVIVNAIGDLIEELG